MLSMRRTLGNIEVEHVESVAPYGDSFQRSKAYIKNINMIS
jgi:hypothetical protein